MLKIDSPQLFWRNQLTQIAHSLRYSLIYISPFAPSKTTRTHALDGLTTEKLKKKEDQQSIVGKTHRRIIKLLQSQSGVFSKWKW